MTLASERAGPVGADGATRAGSFDLGFLGCVPILVTAVPSDENECRRLLTTAFWQPGPAAVRYPRRSGAGASHEPGPNLCPSARAPPGAKAAGSASTPSSHSVRMLRAAEALDATVVDMRFVRPRDGGRVLELARSHERLVTVEENAVMGGAGAAVSDCLAANDVQVRVRHCGLPDRFLEQDTQENQRLSGHLDAAGLVATVQKNIIRLVYSTIPSVYTWSKSLQDTDSPARNVRNRHE